MEAASERDWKDVKVPQPTGLTHAVVNRLEAQVLRVKAGQSVGNGS
jgi:hypothetical protein